MTVSFSSEARVSLGLIAAWIAVFGCGYLAVTNKYNLANTQPAHTARQLHQEITEFSYREYGAHGLITRLEADTLSVIPRRFLFFNIKSLNEVHLTNARIETHLYENVSSDHELVPLATDLFIPGETGKKESHPRREFGLITRSVAKGIVVKIFRADSLALVLRAESAYIEREKRKPGFLNATLEDESSTMRIIADKIIWNAKDKVFLVPGHYVAQTASGRASGKGIRIDLDFGVTKL